MYATHQTRIAKENIKRVLGANVHKKAIVYTNTVVQAKKNKISLDNWIDASSSIKGDAILIVGNTHFKLKGALATTFTASATGHYILEGKKLNPQILSGTSGCAGEGLDTYLVHFFIMDGFPDAKITMAQPMGRCGRPKDENEEREDEYIIYITHS